jgi:hypothetical protein
MNHTKALDYKLETIAWGLLFILWGVTVLFDFLHYSIGLVGTGVILIGLNVARSLNGIRTKGNTTVFGILALVWGLLELLGLVLNLPFELPVFPILLVVLGVILLAVAFLRYRETGLASSG